MAQPIRSHVAADTSTPGDISVDLSERRTDMSFQRTRMSADQTLMSVIRTSLTLIVAVALLLIGVLAISSMVFNVGPFN